MKKNEKGIVGSTLFARAFQIRGENFSPVSAKLSGASQIKLAIFRQLFFYCAVFVPGSVFPISKSLFAKTIGARALINFSIRVLAGPARRIMLLLCSSVACIHGAGDFPY